MSLPFAGCAEEGSFFFPMKHLYYFQLSKTGVVLPHLQGLIFSHILMLFSRDLLRSSVLAYRQSIFSYRACLLALVMLKFLRFILLAKSNSTMSGPGVVGVCLRQELGSEIWDEEAATGLGSHGSCLGTGWVWRRQRSYSWALHRHLNRE